MMKEIRMVDLKSQYLKIKAEIDTAILDVMDSTAFINGPEVKALQKNLEDYLGISHVITCANGTDALQIAMMALELKPGDEVITTDFTFISTVEVICLLGLIPVLIDVDPDSFNINTDLIEEAVTEKTKAIIPVHLFGQCAEMEKILKIAEKYDLYIIEDAAQALGSEYICTDNKKKKAGTIGHIGCTSFFPSKNLGAYGDAGAIFTDDENLAEILRSIANHGTDIKYYHHRIGVNSRLDSIQAAILRVKLKYLDKYNSARQKVADHYDNSFINNPKIKIPYRYPGSTHIFHQYTILAQGFDRLDLQEFLKSKGIPAMVYYPVPLHLQKAFSDRDYKAEEFPVTEEICNKVISLPMHPDLDSEQLEYIVENIINFLNIT